MSNTKSPFALALKVLSWFTLFAFLVPLASSQIISIEAQDHNGTVLQNWNSGRWILQCGSTMSCSISADGSTLILQSTGGGGSATPGGAANSIQYNVGGSSLGGLSGNGLVLANGSSVPSIFPLLGTEGYIPTIVNSGVAGHDVLFGSAGLVDSGYVPENSTKKGAVNGYAPLDGSALVPVANLPTATGSVAGILKPDGTSCTVTAGVLSCTGAGGGAVPAGATYSMQYKATSNTLGGLSGNGVPILSSSASPTIDALYGTQNYIPTISNTGVAGDAVLLSSSGLVDAGYVPENLAHRGAPNGYAPLNASSDVPIANLAIATGSTVGVIRPDGTTCTVSGTGVLTCAGSGGGGGGGPFGTLPYDIVTNNAGNTGGHDTYDFVADATNTAQSAITAAATNGGIVELMPTALMNTPFTNPTGVKVNDHRVTASQRLVTEFGAQCDARQGGANFTNASTTVGITYDYFYPVDVGKTLVAVGTVSGVPTAFETKITALISPNGAYPYNAASASTATPFPFTTGFYAVIFGHDDTTSIIAAQASGSALLFPSGLCLHHAITYTGGSMAGLNGGVSGQASFPGEDIWTEPDPATGQGAGGAGAHLHDMLWLVNNQIDPGKGWQIINDSGTTTKAGVYRPIAQRTAISNTPTSRGWFEGRQSNGEGAYNAVASTTAGSAVICTPTAYSPPSVGDTIVFPYLNSVFTTIVSSTAGTCGSGNPRTLAAAMPTGSTSAVAEWFAGLSPQHLSASISAGSCPATLTLANTISPSTVNESNVAPYGLIQIDGEQIAYMGHSNAFTQGVGGASIASNTLMNLQCAQNGTTRAAHASGATVVPLNQFQPSYPWPVTPTENSNDTTPSGNASYYPGINVGNAAFAAPDSNGSTGLTGQGSFGDAVVENISIIAYPNSNPVNNSTGFYFVGLPYSTQFRSISIQGPQNGIMMGTPSLENGGSWANAQPTADGTSWEGIRISTCNNFDFISGGQNSFRDFNVYSQCYDNPTSTYTGNGAGMYFTEGWDDEGGYPFSSEGNTSLSNMYEEAEFGEYFGLIPTYEFDISKANWDNLHMGSGTEAYIGGNDQQFIGGNFNGGSSIPVINYGAQNGSERGLLLVNGSGFANNTYGSSGFINYSFNTNFQSAFGAGNNSLTPPFSPTQQFGGRARWGGQNNETFNLGNVSAPFTDSNGGYIPAWEFNTSYSWENQPFTVPVQYDPTSPNGFSVGCAVNTVGSQNCFEYKFNQVGIGVGPNQRIVAGKYTMYVASKSTGAATQYTIQVGVCGLADSGTFIVPVSSTWAVQQFQVDLTGKGSCFGGISTNFIYSSPSNDTISVAYIDFAPVAQNFQATAATIGTLTSTSILTAGLTDSNLVAGQCVTAGTGGVLQSTGAACGSGGGGGGGGSVTSVGVTVPAWLNITGSPITSSGTISIVSASEPQGEFLGSPATGTGVLVPRAIVPSDIPTLNQNTTGSAGSINSNTFPANGAFTAGGIAYFPTVSSMGSTSVMTQYGVIYGGGASGAPGVTAADTNTTHALFATGTSPAFRAILPTDIPTLNQNTTGSAGTATSASTVNTNNYPGAGAFISGGIPYFSSNTTEASSALLTHYGVIYGGGAGGAPVATAASTTVTQALFATAGAPAFRNLASADLPVGSASQIGGVQCGTGITCSAGVLSEVSNTVTTSTPFIINSHNSVYSLVKATGPNTVGPSAFTDDGTNAELFDNGFYVVGTAGNGSGATIYTNNISMNGNLVTGTILVSGGEVVGSLQNGVPASPIYIYQAGGGVIALDVNGGLEVDGSLSIGSNNYGTAGQCLESQGSGQTPTWATCGTGGGGGSGSGTVTSVGFAAPSWLAVSGAPITASGVITLATTSQSQSFFLASPNNTAGGMTPRAITAQDIPQLNQSTTGSAGSVPYSGLTGTAPTWNQNTTGTAANLTGCTPSTAGSLCYWNGTTWALVAGNATGTQFLQESGSGVPSWTTPTGSGTVSGGTLGHFGYYAANGTVISSNANLDDGVSATNTLTYSASGGVTAKSFQSTGTGNGSAVFGGSTSGALTMTVPSTVVPYTMIWPGAAPTTGNTYLSCTAAAPSVCSWAVGGSGSSGAFSGLGSGTNTSAAMIVGSGASLSYTGSGTINATNISGNTYPGSGAFTQGGIPYFSANNVEASTGVLAQYGVLYGGGTGAAPQATAADLTSTHVLFATAGAPAFRAITAGDIPTLNQNTTGSAGSLTSFSLPSLGSVASASTVTLPGTGGYAVITGTATINTLTVPSGCVGGSIACTYSVVSANGFSVLINNVGGTTNNINGSAPLGSTVIIPGGSIANFTYDPNNGLWHFMAQPVTYYPIYVHTITGAAPTIALNSAVIASQDTDYLTLSANTTSLTLPASTAVADGETLTMNVQQPTSGSAFTLAAGTAASPLTAGSGTTLINTVPGGCPSIGTVVSSAPSQLIMSLTYKASLTQWQILGCQTFPSQTAVNEATLSTGWIQMGGTGSAVVLAGTRPSNAGHFTNLQINYGGGTCTTAPYVNVFDGTSSFGTPVQGSTTYQGPGLANNAAQTLAFGAGDNIGIEISTAGSGCSTGFYSISAQYAQP
jgi:hypothetical protein